MAFGWIGSTAAFGAVEREITPYLWVHPDEDR
jgi:hypothetical protein